MPSSRSATRAPRYDICPAFEGATCRIVIAKPTCEKFSFINFPLSLASICRAVYEEASEYLGRHLKESMIIQDHYALSYDLAALIPVILIQNVHGLSLSYPDTEGRLFQNSLSQTAANIKSLPKLKVFKMDAGPFYKTTRDLRQPHHLRRVVFFNAKLLQRTHAAAATIRILSKLLSKDIESIMTVKLYSLWQGVRPRLNRRKMVDTQVDLAMTLSCDRAHPRSDGDIRWRKYLVDGFRLLEVQA